MNVRPPTSGHIQPPVSVVRPSEHVHYFHRHHCRYEVRLSRSGATVTATPLTQRAKDWMAQQRCTFLQLKCARDFAGMTVRNVECAIDCQ